MRRYTLPWLWVAWPLIAAIALVATWNAPTLPRLWGWLLPGVMIATALLYTLQARRAFFAPATEALVRGVLAGVSLAATLLATVGSSWDEPQAFKLWGWVVAVGVAFFLVANPAVRQHQPTERRLDLSMQHGSH